MVDASRHSPMPAYGRKYHPYQLKAAMMDALVPRLDRHLCFWKSSKLRVSLLRSFWMKKNHSSSGWMRRTCSPMLWCCRHRLISSVSTWLTPRWYSPDTTPGLWCRIAELQTGGVSCLCLVNLFSRSRIIQITVQLSPQDF